MDYNKIKTFLVVAECGSVTKAASLLHRTQSAISQQLQGLEEELGLALLERKRSRLFLTVEGEALAKAASVSLVSLDEEVAGLRKDLRSTEGHVRLGVLADYGNKILCHHLAGFRQRYPKIDIGIQYGTSAEIEAGLIANELDLGILVNFKTRDLFEAHEIAVETHLVVTSKEYLAKHPGLNSYRGILEADLIDFTDDFLCLGAWYKKNSKALLPSLLHRKPAVTLQSHDGMKEIIKGGFGLGILPSYLIEPELKNGRLVPLMKKSQALRVGVDLAVKKKRSPKLWQTLFMDYLIKR